MLCTQQQNFACINTSPFNAGLSNKQSIPVYPVWIYPTGSTFDMPHRGVYKTCFGWSNQVTHYHTYDVHVSICYSYDHADN